MRTSINSIEHVYVITLQDVYPDRYSYMTNWFRTNGLLQCVTFWKGVAPAQLDPNQEWKYARLSEQDDIDFRTKVAASTRSYNTKLIYDPTELNGRLAYNKCLFQSNAEIFADACKRGFNTVMIIEDDVIFQDGFVQKLEEYMNQFKTLPLDILTIGDGCKQHIQHFLHYPDTYQLSTNIWNHGLSHVRCTDSIVYNKVAIQKLATYMNGKNKRHLTIDWEYNWLFKHLGLRVGWAEPTICTQSSQM